MIDISKFIKNAFFKKPLARSDPRRDHNELDGGRRKGENDNPYLAARRTWNDQSAANVANRQMWQLMGILSLMIGLAGVGGVIYVGSLSKFIPYVVEVDRHGTAYAFKPAETTSSVDPRIVHATVATFIGDIRMVTPDIALQRQALDRVYAMLATTDPASTKVDEWYNSSEQAKPLIRATTETVSIVIESVIKQTADTWQVDWTETTRDRQGLLKGQPFHMRALVTVYTVPATSDITEAQIRKNPLGIFVRDYSWAKPV